MWSWFVVVALSVILVARAVRQPDEPIYKWGVPCVPPLLYGAIALDQALVVAAAIVLSAVALGIDAWWRMKNTEGVTLFW
jgi:ABC-type uncharacterized transport system permease subunit